MISRPLALGLLAAGCVSAAAGGAYVALRQNAAEPTVAAAAPSPAPASPAVAETEAVIATPAAATPVEADASRSVEPEAPRPVEPAAAASVRSDAAKRPAPEPAQAPAKRPSPEAVAAPARRPATPPPTSSDTPERAAVAETAHAPLAPVEMPRPEPTRPADEPAAPPAREMVEVVVPTSSVLGLQVETALSSENARVEDRVEARVTRDVNADDRIAIPAGSRVLGAVTLVERGGKLKERARLGIRFHTLVLADGSQIPIQTESVFREGDSPGGESARKIGGAAIGGAILGALIGGGKGAAVGGAAGAAGGTAVVMAGDRNAATLPAGTVVSVRLSSPVTLAVERK